MNTKLRTVMIILLVMVVALTTVFAVYERPLDEEGKPEVYGYSYKRAQGGVMSPLNATP